VNSERVGRTPYDVVRDSGEVTVKLIPESGDSPLAPHEAKVNLVSGVKTTVRWDFGETAIKSAGDIVSFEKETNGVTSVALISTPDSAQVIIDGSIKGFSPTKTTVTPGDHKILVSATGFTEREIPVVAIENYKLTAIVKLAENDKVPEPTPSPTPEPEIKKVKILNTGVGFLRVRDEPSTFGEEVGRVEPGKEYEFSEIDKDSGWYKIVYDTSSKDLVKSGWVSGEYVEEIEIAPSPSPKSN